MSSKEVLFDYYCYVVLGPIASIIGIVSNIYILYFARYLEDTYPTGMGFVRFLNIADLAVGIFSLIWPWLYTLAKMKEMAFANNIHWVTYMAFFHPVIRSTWSKTISFLLLAFSFERYVVMVRRNKFTLFRNIEFVKFLSLVCLSLGLLFSIPRVTWYRIVYYDVWNPQPATPALASLFRPDGGSYMPPTDFATGPSANSPASFIQKKYTTTSFQNYQGSFSQSTAATRTKTTIKDPRIVNSFIAPLLDREFEPQRRKKRRKRRQVSTLKTSGHMLTFSLLTTQTTMAQSITSQQGRAKSGQSRLSLTQSTRGRLRHTTRSLIPIATTSAQTISTPRRIYKRISVRHQHFLKSYIIENSISLLIYTLMLIATLRNWCFVQIHDKALRQNAASKESNQNQSFFHKFLRCCSCGLYGRKDLTRQASIDRLGNARASFDVLKQYGIGAGERTDPVIITRPSSRNRSQRMPGLDSGSGRGRMNIEFPLEPTKSQKVLVCLKRPFNLIHKFLIKIRNSIYRVLNKVRGLNLIVPPTWVDTDANDYLEGQETGQMGRYYRSLHDVKEKQKPYTSYSLLTVAENEIILTKVQYRSSFFKFVCIFPGLLMNILFPYFSVRYTDFYTFPPWAVERYYAALPAITLLEYINIAITPWIMIATIPEMRTITKNLLTKCRRTG